MPMLSEGRVNGLSPHVLDVALLPPSDAQLANQCALSKSAVAKTMLPTHSDGLALMSFDLAAAALDSSSKCGRKLLVETSATCTHCIHLFSDQRSRRWGSP